MDWPLKAIRSLFDIKPVRFLILELGALFVSILLVGAVGMIAASIAGYFYDINHAISNPVARGDDMGSGLIMIVAALGSLLVSLPISVLIHIYVFKKFSKGSIKDE